MDDLLIGVDLGGTNVRVGSVTPEGQLLTVVSAPIEAARGPEAGMEKVSTMIAGLLEQYSGHSLQAIGIGASGPVDRALGAIQNPYTLPTWENVSVVSLLEQRFRVPVNLENDADAAALGEAWVGAGRGLQRVAAVTVGTGIGTSLILDGKIYRGLNGWHPEGGHIVLDPSGPACYCGSNGCWESLTAGPAIARLAQIVAEQEGGSMLAMAGGVLENIDARTVARAAEQGDAPALRVVEEVADYIGLGLVNIIMLYLPDVIVLSGGVMQSYDLFAPGIYAVLRQRNVVVPANKVQVVKTQMEGKSGVIGAARSATYLIEEQTL